MIKSIEICHNHRRFIDGRKHITFNSGLNVVIGPNGSGKSSLLKAIYDCPDCICQNVGATIYHYFDSETMNPHRSGEYLKGTHGSIIRCRAMFSSHGETMRDVLGFLNFGKGDTLLLDEPESGHDFKWVLKIRRGFEKISRMGCQIIIASHHPLFWDAEYLIELERGYKEQVLTAFKKRICLD